jgi:hypothetical protein
LLAALEVLKFIEKNSERVWLTSESDTKGKILTWAIIAFFGLFILLWADDTFTYGVGAFGITFFMLALSSVADTLFDIERNLVKGKWRVAGINLRNIESPIDTSSLLGVMAKYNPNLYLVLENGKKYRICDFWTSGHYDAVMSELLEYVPIKHQKNF